MVVNVCLVIYSESFRIKGRLPHPVSPCTCQFIHLILNLRCLMYVSVSCARMCGGIACTDDPVSTTGIAFRFPFGPISRGPRLHEVECLDYRLACKRQCFEKCHFGHERSGRRIISKPVYSRLPLQGPQTCPQLRLGTPVGAHELTDGTRRAKDSLASPEGGADGSVTMSSSRKGEGRFKVR